MADIRIMGVSSDQRNQLMEQLDSRQLARLLGGDSGVSRIEFMTADEQTSVGGKAATDGGVIIEVVCSVLTDEIRDSARNLLQQWLAGASVPEGEIWFAETRSYLQSPDGAKTKEGVARLLPLDSPQEWLP